MSTTANAICANNDYLYGPFAITTPSATTGLFVPATGLLTVSGFLSATIGGAALPNTTLAMAEYSGTPGTYGATLASAVVNVAIVGVSALYLAVSTSSNSLLIWTRIPVVANRVE